MTINYPSTKRIQFQITKDLIIIKKKNSQIAKPLFSNTPKSVIGEINSPNNSLKRKYQKDENFSSLTNHQMEIINKYLKDQNLYPEQITNYSLRIGKTKVKSPISNYKLSDSATSKDKDEKKAFRS